MEHSVDAIRAEDAISQRLGYEEHIPGQTRDWNEELQTTRELPRKNLPDRLIRERAIFKVKKPVTLESDFCQASEGDVPRKIARIVSGKVLSDCRFTAILWWPRREEPWLSLTETSWPSTREKTPSE